MSLSFRRYASLESQLLTQHQGGGGEGGAKPPAEALTGESSGEAKPTRALLHASQPAEALTGQAAAGGHGQGTRGHNLRKGSP